MSRPAIVKGQVSVKPVNTLEDIREALNRELIPVLRATRAGVNQPITEIDTDYTVTVDDYRIQVDASAGAVTLTLPSATIAARPVVVKKVDATANAVTLVVDGGGTIDGGVSYATTTNVGALRVYSDGAEWWSE